MPHHTDRYETQCLSRQAITFIELLVVIAIMMLLMGLILGAWGPLQRTVKRSRTSAALGIVRQGLVLHATEQGSSVAPVVHPVARSLPTRGLFYRDGSTTGFARDAAVAIAGEALTACDPTQVAASARDRLLLPGDRFAGYAAQGDWPALYGLPRSMLRRIGIAPGFSTLRQLPDARSDPRLDADGDGVLDLPYDHTRYADARFRSGAPALINLESWPAAAHAAMQATLGGTAYDDLRDLECLVDGSNTNTALNGALSVGLPDDGIETTTALITSSDGTNGWQMWRHRGPSLIDAWGGEILAYTNTSGDLILMSAGPDGAFYWHPGSDHLFMTSATATPGVDTPAGDDQRGDLDNIVDGKP
jgi:type II secretory pathway pseudopilin PulG